MSLVAWFQTNFIKILLVAAAAGLVYLGFTHYTQKVTDLADAKSALVEQGVRLDNLSKEFGKFKESTEASLDSLKSLKEEVAQVDTNAKARDNQTAGKIAGIKNNASLTVEQKKVETSRVFAENLQTTYCMYFPAGCPAPTPPPAVVK